MKAPDVICIDFETEAIQNRPHYPPRPVVVAIAWPDEQPHYVTDSREMTQRLYEVWGTGLPILCHHAKFDLAVACEGLGLPELPWQRVHDTMFLAYLCDPHARSLGLKQLAQDLLNWPPEERNELDDWIWSHRESLNQQYGATHGTVKKTKLGAWIAYAPAELVGPYACGDVARTRALFEHLWPLVQENGMGAAYDRERQLLPILVDNERIGIRVALGHLENDIEIYSEMLGRAEAWLRTELRASGLNFDADRDVSAVLLERGIVPRENWSLTKSGQLSMSKEALLPEHFTDPRIASALGYRNRLTTCLGMFMRPWQAQASQRKSYVSTNWNQVRGDKGGTRTGRPSTSDPNFLNISKTWNDRNDGYVHPAFLGVAELPLVRRYLLPDEGEVWLHRDFEGQEMRVFADFEQGALWRQYEADPMLDPHAWVREIILQTTGTDLIRTKVKNTNFARLYGGGIPAVQRRAQCASLGEAREVAAFCDNALPGRKLVNEEITRVVRRGDPIRTWGGRLYYPERPGADGRDKIYKLLNYAVQGSAADLTKQALIDWCAQEGHARFLVTVYDEINISAAPEYADGEMQWLQDIMETPRLSVPMRSSGKRGPTWGDLDKCQ